MYEFPCYGVRISQDDAGQIVKQLTLNKRVSGPNRECRGALVENVARELTRGLGVECFFALFLDGHHNLLGVSRLCTGDERSVQFSTRQLLTIAFMVTGTAAVITGHNHVFGPARPSEADMKMHARVRQACDSVDLQLLDNVIVAPDEFYSFADAGLP